MKNTNKKIYILLGSVLVIFLLAIFSLSIIINGDKICKDTYVNNINIGNLTKAQAIKKLENLYKLENVEFRYNDKQFIIEPNEINFSYDITQTVENAYDINRKGTFIENIKQTISSLIGKKNTIDLSVNYNKEKLKLYIEELSKDINVPMKNASINIQNSNIQIQKDEVGVKLDEDKSFLNSIKELEKGSTTIELVVENIQPDIREENLENIETIIGQYSTKFDSSVAGRSHNIELAAKSTSNVLLMPGETFSYNEHTGKRTISNGYKNAPVIVQGVVQEGVGGGVCQVSTTLYNAVLYAGLEIESIKNHSIPSSYVQKGRDATVSDGAIDFIFKNNLEYPVYIKNSVYGNTLTCTIYGSKEDKQNIEIVTNTDNVSEAPIKKVDDPTLPKGEEKRLESGRYGYTVSTYRVYKDGNGNEIKKEKVYVSYYPKKQEIIAVGTMEQIQEEPIITEDENIFEEDNTSQNENTTTDESNQQNPLVQPPVEQETVEQEQINP
ncbi:VanW family protein [Romboutsia sp. 13368]|uniref:VanW family protein n=1 Tax=Romboutsia sp. 13368 TaxID=2708053 RepID=UPI0025DE6FCC|nr:VanW family protein [Romboutsia sp. 13368]